MDPWDERYIYLHEWLICIVNVGKYTIHGCYGRRFENQRLDKTGHVSKDLSKNWGSSKDCQIVQELKEHLLYSQKNI